MRLVATRAEIVSAGASSYTPPAGNVITNWRGTGTGGTSGLPDTWSAATVAGVTLSVLSRMPYRGGTIIEYQFAGTAGATGAIYVTPGGLTTVAAAASQVWAQRVYAEPVGAQSHLTSCAIHWRNSSFVYLGQSAGAAMNGTITGAQALPADATAPASTAFSAHVMAAVVTSGQSVSVRMKVFAPVLWRVS